MEVGGHISVTAGQIGTIFFFGYRFPFVTRPSILLMVDGSEPSMSAGKLTDVSITETVN